MKRIVAILLLALMLFGLCACGKGDYAHGSQKTVLKLGGHKVTEEVYRYFLLNTMDEMAGDDADYFAGADREEKLKELDERVLDSLKQYYAVLDLADKKGIEMSESQLESIDDTLKSLKESCETDEDYRTALAQAYLSEYMAYSVLYNENLFNAIYVTMSSSNSYFSTEGSDILEYSKKNFLFCRQFVIKTDDVEADGEAKEKARTIYDRLKSGEDAAEVLADYESDENVIGAYYCFAESEDFTALDEAAVMDMEVGEISEIRTDGYGFHIIIRLATDTEYLEENLSDAVFESYCMDRLNQMLDDIMDDYSVEYKDKKEPEEYR